MGMVCGSSVGCSFCVEQAPLHLVCTLCGPDQCTWHSCGRLEIVLCTQAHCDLIICTARPAPPLPCTAHHWASVLPYTAHHYPPPPTTAQVHRPPLPYRAPLLPTTAHHCPALPTSAQVHVLARMEATGMGLDLQILLQQRGPLRRWLAKLERRAHKVHCNAET